MKILIIGLGSMGKRRIRNLQNLGIKEILGFDIEKSEREYCHREYGIFTVNRIQDAIKEKPDAIIISTPPNQHLKYAKIAIDNKINFFTELNHSSKDIKKLIKKLRNTPILGVPSSTMRYHPIVIELEKLIKKNTIGTIIAFHHYNGQHLKTWHPWDDYKKFFFSKKETGGAKELVPFELNWITLLFGNIISVNSTVKKISDLDSNIDDYYAVHTTFENNVEGNLVFDVFANPSFRETKIIGSKGVIQCDFKTGLLQISKNNKLSKKKISLGKIATGYSGNTPPENLYENEIKNFLDSCYRKQKPSFSLSDELKILQVLDSIELSNKKGKKLFC